MNFILFGLIFVAIQFCDALDEWEQFKIKFKKDYISQDVENYRYKIFNQNMKKVQHHNQKYQNGKESFEMGINQFSDISSHEFKKLHLSNQDEYDEIRRHYKTYRINPITEIPSSIDWRDSNIISPVKNQLACGACWAFAATGAIESQFNKTTGSRYLFSEQDLIDCSRPYLNKGCRGGLALFAFEYVSKNGISTESSYPYQQNDRYQCRRSDVSSGLKNSTVQKFGLLVRNDENNLKIAVAEIGPIAISYLLHRDFQHYKTGVYHRDDCKSGSHHAMLIVGFGTENDQDYWILKNSWGPYWGDNGFVKVARNKLNTCGIARNAVFIML